MTFLHFQNINFIFEKIYTSPEGVIKIEILQ